MRSTVRNMLFRIKNILFYDTRPQPVTTDPGYGWRVTHNAATLPQSMNMWKADPEADKGFFEEINPTEVIPKYIPEGPEKAFIALSFNEVDAFCTAARTLRTTRSIDTVLAGLEEYVALHPVAA